MPIKDQTFCDFVLDQLSGLDDVYARRMFGAFGLYQNDIFFGIIANGKLYFKTSADTRAVYENHSSKPFRYQRKDSKGKKKWFYLKNYFEVPVDVLEDSSQLQEWAHEAVDKQK